MGAKRTGSRKYLFLYFACCMTLFLTGNACWLYTGTRPDEKAVVVDHDLSSTDSLPQNNPVEMSSSLVSDENTFEHLDAAYFALAEGNYTTAASEIEIASMDGPPTLHPETIYLTALLYADPKNPAGDMTRASETLQRIEKEHPDSDRAGEVRILIDLLQAQQSMKIENQRLRQELSELKKKLVAEQNSVQRLKSLLNKMKEIDLGLMPEEQ